jgi:hypothetical protein
MSHFIFRGNMGMDHFNRNLHLKSERVVTVSFFTSPMVIFGRLIKILSIGVVGIHRKLGGRTATL